MKNHLSMEGSMGRRLIVARRDMRSRMLINAIRGVCHRKIHPKTLHFPSEKLKGKSYVLTPSGGLVLPVIRRSHASLHSLMTSRAYFLFLHSPLNANEFSCFPSGISHQPPQKWEIVSPCKSSRIRWWHGEDLVNVFRRLRCR